jgi:hypothetical protein
MKKYITIIYNWLVSLIYKWKIRQQAHVTAQLRKNRRTDYARWEKPEQIFEDWNERTKILASMIQPEAVVIEFGAGNMALKNMLPTGCQYTPSDIVQRHPAIIKCDLNENILFDLSVYNTAVFSGVLEYVFDIEGVFKQFPANLLNVLLSYTCSDISSANRLENGWLSDYTKNELEGIFRKHNYQILNYTEWRKQSLFQLKKVN